MEFKRLLTIRAVDKKSRLAELDSEIDVDEKIVFSLVLGFRIVA